MSFVTCSSIVVRISKTRVFPGLFLIVMLSVYLLGCRDQVLLLPAEQLVESENASSGHRNVDLDHRVGARINEGAYRVVAGDVPGLTMPAILHVVATWMTEATEHVAPYVCRVSENAAIDLRAVSQPEVAGKTLAQIESGVIDAYQFEYTVTHPSVSARVTHYNKAGVFIIRAANSPGIHELRRDKMSLATPLAEAGGVIDEGAARIRMIHSGEGTTHYGRAPKPVTEHAAYPAAGNPQCEQRKKTGVRLTLEQSARPSTTSLLVVKLEESIPLTEKVDVANPGQRQEVLSKLAQKRSRAQATRMRERLCALEAVLQIQAGKPTACTQPPIQPAGATQLHTRQEYACGFTCIPAGGVTNRGRLGPFNCYQTKQRFAVAAV